MSTELDLYRAASVLLKEYGTEAEAIAARRVRALTELGEVEGAATFLRIIELIGELRRTEPKADEPTH